MTRPIVLLAMLLVAVAQRPTSIGLGPLCLGAHLAIAAQAPERETPDGEWCQRPPVRSTKAHACSCHQHDCKADPRDPNNLSAHTDSRCLNYCHTNKCTCGATDCP